MDEHKDLPSQATSIAPIVSLESLQADIKSCGMNGNFILINDIGFGVRPIMELNYGKYAATMNTKLNLSHQGRLYGKTEITGKRPVDKCILKEESDSWRAFKSELRFIATHFCHWHSHPNIIRYHGLAILKKEEKGCVPYLLSEHVD